MGRPGVGRESRRREWEGRAEPEGCSLCISSRHFVHTHERATRRQGRRPASASTFPRLRCRAAGDATFSNVQDAADGTRRPLRRLPMAARLSRRPAPTIRPGSRVRQQRRLWANCRWAWPGRCVVWTGERAYCARWRQTWKRPGPSARSRWGLANPVSAQRAGLHRVRQRQRTAASHLAAPARQVPP